MATTLMLSLSGSPGVTTTAVGLTEAWDRNVVLIEADTSKSSSVLPGYLLGQVPWPGKNLVNLAVAWGQHGQITHHDLWAQLHPLNPGDGQEATKQLLPGLKEPRQQVNLGRVWPDLAQAAQRLDSAGTDVLIDAGQWQPGDQREALLQAADLVILIARPTLPDAFAALNRLEELRDVLKSVGHAGHLRLVTVQTLHSGQSSDDFARTLQLPLMAQLPEDPESAAVWSYGAPPALRHHKKPLPKALGHLVTSIQAATRDTRALVAHSLDTELEGL